MRKRIESGNALRLVVMSATLDAAKFCAYFDGAKAAYIQAGLLV